MASGRILEKPIPIYKEYNGVDEQGRSIIRTVSVIEDIGCDLWPITCITCPYPICAKHEAKGMMTINKWIKEGV